MIDEVDDISSKLLRVLAVVKVARIVRNYHPRVRIFLAYQADIPHSYSGATLELKQS